jgi:hypothetical protein
MSLTRGQKLALAVSMVMALPALSVGFYADDWIHEARQRGLTHGYPRTWTHLFECARIRCVAWGDSHRCLARRTIERPCAW